MYICLSRWINIVRLSLSWFFINVKRISMRKIWAYNLLLNNIRWMGHISLRLRHIDPLSRFYNFLSIILSLASWKLIRPKLSWFTMVYWLSWWLFWLKIFDSWSNTSGMHFVLQLYSLFNTCHLFVALHILLLSRFTLYWPLRFMQIIIRFLFRWYHCRRAWFKYKRLS